MLYFVDTTTWLHSVSFQKTLDAFPGKICSFSMHHIKLFANFCCHLSQNFITFISGKFLLLCKNMAFERNSSQIFMVHSNIDEKNNWLILSKN